MIKITHLTSVHKYNDTRIFLKECSSLANAGYKVSLIAPKAEEGIYSGVTVYSLEQEYKNRLDRIKNSRKDIFKKALQLDSDIYHFHDPELLPVGLKLKKIGKKVIYDVHEDVPRQIMSKHWIPKIMRRPTALIFQLYENYVAKKIDAIVTATPFINKRFKKINIQSVNVNNYPIINEQKLKGNNQKKSNVFCYIGGINENRGLFEMVQATRLSKSTLYLGGTFSNKDEEKEAKDLNDWDNVNFLGFLSREEVYRTYDISIGGLVTLHPIINYIDSLPIKMFEYMAAGLPVIASDFPLWKEIIDGNNCGICVDPLNANEIAQAMQWIKDNPEKAVKMGRNGVKAVKEKYNWQKESEKLINLYIYLIK